MPVCAIASCKTVFCKGSSISFFSFPSQPALRDKWVTVCKRADKFNPDTSRICSLHFRKVDYNSSYLWQRQLCPDIQTLPRLKRDAVPSLQLPDLNTDVTIKRKFRLTAKQQKKKKLRYGARIDVIDIVGQLSPATTSSEKYLGTSKDGTPKAAQEAAPQKGRSVPDDPADDPAEWRRRSKQLRRQRHERKERKELVEQLLADHEEQQQLQEAAAKTKSQVKVILLNRGDDTRKTGGDTSDTEEYILPDFPAAEDSAGDSQPLTGAGGAQHSGPPGGAPAGPPAPRTTRSFIYHRPPARGPSLMVERTKEILRLKLKVRKLEAKCLRVLGATGALGSDAGGGGGGGEGREAVDDGQGQAERPERPPAEPAPAAGEIPLVVLRDEKLPTILAQLRQSRQSDGLNTLTPSGLREAQEINHQLKVQMFSLQAAMLKWVIKNKRMRDRLRKAREGGEKHQRTVRAVRLRELLRLESAVKAMFSESQIRAMTRQHGDDSIPPSKRKGATHWGEEDLRRVLELRAISSDRVVEHVRDKMKIPLPSMQTTRKRCYKSPALNEVYREIMQKSEDSRKLCPMCERQVSTIDEVIDAAADELSDDDATYGRQFVQHVPSPSPPRSPEQPVAPPRPRKRRRVPAAAPAKTKKVRTPAVSSHNWAETESDSDLSDPGIWDRLGSHIPTAVPGQLSGRFDDHLRRQPPDPYGMQRQSWR